MIEIFMSWAGVLLSSEIIKGLAMILFLLVGVMTALVPESLVRIIPEIKGHPYKRVAFAFGLSVSVIAIGVLSSWFLGPGFLGWASYLLWSLALGLASLQALQLIAFIHPRIAGKEAKYADNRLIDSGIKGLRTGLYWGSDRFPVYIWLIANTAIVGWHLAAMMILSFLFGNIATSVWIGRRYERIAKIATRPYYGKIILRFLYFLGVLMLVEAAYLFYIVAG